jgi:hypothetical protein
MPALRRAVLVAMLDVIPREPSFGELPPTSDNVALYGHPVRPDGWVAAEYGAVSTVLMGGLRLGDEDSQIRPPIELPTPWMTRDLDAIYAQAAHVMLKADAPESRRLARTID